jgi:non-heme chloroperoxidase
MSNLAFVSTDDGLSLAVCESGPRSAPPIVFVHGIAQSKQSWQGVLAGPLSARRRLVALDLRGHGDSDKPAGPEAFARPRLASDLAAVIRGLGLERPTIVAWSYGGVVLGEYLRRHGDGALGGVVLAAASIRTGRDALDLYGPAMLNNGRALVSDDAAVYEAGARAFLAGCTARPLPPDALEAAVAAMRVVPPHVRRALLSGSEDYRPEYAATRVPVATLHGDLDAVVAPAMSDMIAALRPGIRQARLAGVGHLPWAEEPALFTATLTSLLSPPSPALHETGEAAGG